MQTRIGLLLLAAVSSAACEVARDGTTMQAVAGPAVTVTVRGEGQLAVSWTADAAASQYQVFQSAAGGALAVVASVFDSSGGAPPTSYVADALTASVQYCYAVRAGYPDGTVSELATPRCETAAGAAADPPPATLRRRNVPLAVQFANPTNAWTPTGSGLRSVSTGGLNQGDSATTIDVPFEIGDTVVGAEVWRFSDGTGGRKAALLVLAAGNDFIIAASEDSIDSTATTRTMTSINQINGVSPHTMAAGERLRFLVFARPSPGYTIDAVNLVYTAAAQ